MSATMEATETKVAPATDDETKKRGRSEDKPTTRGVFAASIKTRVRKKFHDCQRPRKRCKRLPRGPARCGKPSDASRFPRRRVEVGGRRRHPAARPAEAAKAARCVRERSLPRHAHEHDPQEDPHQRRGRRFARGRAPSTRAPTTSPRRRRPRPAAAARAAATSSSSSTTTSSAARGTSTTASAWCDR